MSKIFFMLVDEQWTTSYLILSCEWSRSSYRGPSPLGWRAYSSPEQSYHFLITSCALSDKRSKVMWRLECGGLSEPTPFSASTHFLIRSPREILRQILPTFYHSCYLVFHIDSHRQSPPRESYLMA